MAAECGCNGGHQTLNEFDGNDIQKKKKGQRANTAGPDGCETWREQNHMQQHTWTQTADTKHVKGGKAIYLLSHTQLHARLSKHSSIGRPYRESTGFFKLGIRTKYLVIKLLKYLLNYGVVVKSNNIPVNCLQRSMCCLFFQTHLWMESQI